MTAEYDGTRMPEITRPMIESEIERLISILDWLDPDPDFEDGGDDEPSADPEPLYGWTDLEARFNRHGPDLDECELDEADKEPSLGSVGNASAYASQAHWGMWAGDDREEDCEDEGAQCEDEGCVDEDRGADEDDAGGSIWDGRPSYEEQEATTRACQGAIARVRYLQQQRGQKPIEPLRVLGGMAVRS